MDYKEQTKRAMEMLAEDDRVMFLGQTVVYPGSPMNASLKDIPLDKRLEMPVAENMQMGISLGLSFAGYVPVSIYPRIDFLICAIDQLGNHVDKVREMTHGQFDPRMIIRTQIGNTEPLYPGLQHCGDYTDVLEALCKNVVVEKIKTAERIVPAYMEALGRDKPTILVEIPTGGSKAQIDEYARLERKNKEK